MESNKEMLLHRVFEKQANQKPKAIAVVHGEKQVSYETLNGYANGIADQLFQESIEEGQMVGLFLENSIEFIAGMLAILKVGGHYLPLNPKWPPSHLEQILQDSQVEVIVSLPEFFPENQHDCKVIPLVPDDKNSIPQKQENPEREISIETPMYVIYTSGSTGTPKGVVVSHQNVWHLFNSVQSCFCFDKDDIWTLYHSGAFGFSIWEIWGAFWHGAQLLINHTTTIDHFFRLVSEKNATVLSLTPSAFSLFSEVDQKEPFSRSGLKYLILSGEALWPHHVNDWLHRHGDQSPQLINMFAMTETSGELTYHVIKQDDLNLLEVSNIGKPLPGTTIHIMDEQLQPVEPGTVGEMVVESKMISCGYFNNPEENQKKFIEAKLEDGRTVRRFRTGDFAKCLPNGTIEFSGRRDSMVKIFGHRIELKTVQSALNSHPQIKQAVVRLFHGKQGDRLLAYVASRDPQVSPADLYRFTKDKIPLYMVPSFFVLVQSFPLNSNGKIAFDQLPLPEESQNSGHHECEQPLGQVEERVAAICSEVLGHPILKHDHFFEAGGTSLHLLRIHDLLQYYFPNRVSKISLFQYSTIHLLSKFIVSQQEAPTNPYLEKAKKRAALRRSSASF